MTMVAGNAKFAQRGVVKNVGLVIWLIGAILGTFGAIVESVAAQGLHSDAFLPDGRKAGFPIDGPTGDGDEYTRTRVPGRYIVVLKDSIDQPGAFAREQARARGGDVGGVYHSALKGYAAKLPKSAVEALRQDPRVRYVVPDYEVKLASQVNPFGISRISALGNPELDIDEKDDVRINADVAIIDSGIDHTHPDLNVFARTNCVPVDEESEFEGCIDNTGTDGHHHGTHVAGIAGAIDNEIGVVGVAPGARLWAVRVLSNEGAGYDSWIIGGIDWVTAHAEQIETANMSLGANTPEHAYQEAIEAGIEKGIVYAVAAGNERRNAENATPANNASVLTVSGLADYNGSPGGGASPPAPCVNRGPDDGQYIESNWGNMIDIVAPGTCVKSTIPNEGYEFLSGTSMASPYVAGAAAVLASKSNPNTKQDVEAIEQTLIDGGSLNWNDTSQDGEFEPLLYLGASPLTATEAGTGGVTTASETSAVVTGALNGRGLQTEYKFEYGPTTEYGSSTTPVVVPSTTKYTTAKATITGVKPTQTYHYRLVVTNSSGTVFGQDRVFTTSYWQIQEPATTPKSPETEWLNDIACPTAKSCMAVGRYWSEEGVSAVTYELVNGEWKSRSVPVPGGGSSPELEGVSCVSPTNCTAVGAMVDYISEPAAVVPWAAHWNGTAWSTESVPAPSAIYSVLKKVSCPSATECVAVGYSKNAEEKWVNYASRLKGGSWSTLAAPDAADSAASELDDISCVSTSYCVAAGWYGKVGGGQRPVFITWNGSTWSLKSSARTNGQVYGVECTSTTFCLAVGQTVETEMWNGSSWSTSNAVVPSGSELHFLISSDCVSTSYCVSVGAYRKAGRYFSLVEIWNGATWHIEPSPVDAESRHELWGVACNGLAGCQTSGFGLEADYEDLLEARRDVITGEASGVTPAEATLNGVVNPGGLSTTYHFEYGLTTSYGTNVPVVDESVGSGSEPVQVSKAITKLQAGTLYHYRLVATNSKGTEYGADKTFKAPFVPSEFKSSFGTTGSGNGQLNRPQGVAVDSEGNIWVADSENNRIQKFNSKGEYLTKFGTKGSANGQLNTPSDIAIDAAGNLWVTDKGNDRIQKFNSKGEYLTKFGTTGSGIGQFEDPWGIAIDSSGNIWVTDDTLNRAQQFTSAGSFIRSVGSGGSGNGQFWGPMGIAVDSGNNIWVVDSGNKRLQKFSSGGFYQSQFGSQGSGNGQFEGARAVDIRPSGSLLVTDRWLGRVQEFSPSGEYQTQFGSGQVGEPEGIATTTGGLAYVASAFKNRIEKWQQPLPEVTTQAASSITASQAVVSGTINPQGLPTTYSFQYGLTTSYGSEAPVPEKSVGSGTEAVALSERLYGLQPETTYHYRLVASNSTGVTYGADKTFKTTIPQVGFSSTFGTTGSGNGQLNRPQGVAVDSEGNIWVADSENNRIQKFNSKGEYVSKFGTKGSANGQLNTPSDIAFTALGNLWVVDKGNDRVQAFNTKGEYLNKFGSTGSGNGQFQDPWGIAIDSSGNIWVTDDVLNRVQQFTSGTGFIRSVGTSGSGIGQFNGPMGIAVDSGNSIWVVDSGNKRLQKFSSGGLYQSQFGSQGSGNGQFEGARAVDIRPSGNLLVTDRWLERVQEFSSGGEYRTQLGAGQVGEAEGIAIGSGNVYVSNASANRIEKWVTAAPPTATTQAASSITGTGAKLAALVNPGGLATSYHFEYGPTIAYGTSAPVPDASLSAGTADQSVSKSISGLSSGTTYHFRIVASNAEGLSYGKDETFTTP